jgi:pilus assembly protein CpaF
MPLPTNPNLPPKETPKPVEPIIPQATVKPSLTPPPTDKQRQILQPGEGINSEALKTITKTEGEQTIIKAVRQNRGKLTSEDILKNEYETFLKPVEKKIFELLELTRERFSQLGADEAIAEARKYRGDKYTEQAANIGEYLFSNITKNNLVRPDQAAKVIQSVINEMIGLGPIEPLWQNSEISEIMVNGPYDIKVEMRGKIVDVPGAQFRDAKHLLELCQKILQDIGREVNASRPTADGRLPDGSRINVVAQTIAPDGPYLTIRRFPDTIFTLKELVTRNAMSEEIAHEIGNLIYKGCSIIISGSTGSGKTSMLNALSGCIPADERVITIEDNLELRLNPSKHILAMEAKQKGAGASDAGVTSIRDLVKNALRMRPDRIIVGEVRDEAAYDMLQAMNTGHDGSMTTVHANDPEGAIERLANLISQIGDFSPERALSLLANGVDAIVQIERYEDGSRRISRISEIPTKLETNGRGLMLNPVTLWEFNQTGTEMRPDSEGNEREYIVGEYVRVNELSDTIIRKHRLDKKKSLTLDELYTISDIPKEELLKKLFNNQPSDS